MTARAIINASLFPNVSRLDTITTHTPTDPQRIENARRRLQQHGQTQPVTVRHHNGTITAIDGHHIIAAARQLGWTFIAVTSAN